ncbi:PhzF family phenazine biosynthesis protein [Comamonas humi]
MRQRRYMQLDVFSSTPYQGNPLAVVLDGEGLRDAQMQDFARWTNLSETTFLLPATSGEADYRVRIFTPVGELAFAGHPTLGSCHAWLAAGGQPRRADGVVQECAKGLVSVQRQGPQLSFAAPPLAREAVPATLQAQVMQALELPAEQLLAAQWLDNGSRWMGLLLREVQSVHAARPQAAALRVLGAKAGLCALHPPGDQPEPVLEVRGIFLTPHGIAEDPATGSLNASLAQWLLQDGHVQTPYLARQGADIGRAGRLGLGRDAAGQVWVGGSVHGCIDGTVTL